MYIIPPNEPHQINQTILHAEQTRIQSLAKIKKQQLMTITLATCMDCIVSKWAPQQQINRTKHHHRKHEVLLLIRNFWNRWKTQTSTSAAPMPQTNTTANGAQWCALNELPLMTLQSSNGSMKLSFWTSKPTSNNSSAPANKWYVCSSAFVVNRKIHMLLPTNVPSSVFQGLLYCECPKWRTKLMLIST